MASIESELFSTIYSRARKSDFKSFDQCDIKGSQLFIRPGVLSYKLGLKKLYNTVVYHSTTRQEGAWRKLLGIKEQSFAQADSFVVRALIHSEVKDKIEHISKLEKRIWSARSSGFNFSAWGQPYDWMSASLMKKNTPRTTVSSQIGLMYVELFKAFQNKSHLEKAVSAGNFFLKEMTRSLDTENHVSFSYGFGDEQMVYNANAMSVAFLGALYEMTQDKRLHDLIEKLIRHIMDHQNSDGSWNYRYKDGRSQGVIDNFHTAYLLSDLFSLRGTEFISGDNLAQLQLGFDFYMNQLFDKHHVPLWDTRRALPKDIMCYAAAIILFSQLEPSAHINKRLSSLLEAVKNEFIVDGDLIHSISGNSRNKNFYIRWGGCWMLYALSTLQTNRA